MIIDIIIIALILLGAFSGYKKGLVTILVGFIGIILSIFLGFMLQTPISDYLQNDTAIGTTINQTIQTSIQKNGAEQNSIYTTILNTVTNGKQDTFSLEQNSKIITSFILKGLSFICVFIIVYIICYILQMVLNLVFDLPILNSLNKIGGVGIGVLSTLIKLTVLFAIISFIVPIPMFSNLGQMIQNSTIGNMLYTNNIIVNLIKSNIKI